MGECLASGEERNRRGGEENLKTWVSIMPAVTASRLMVASRSHAARTAAPVYSLNTWNSCLKTRDIVCCDRVPVLVVSAGARVGLWGSRAGLGWAGADGLAGDMPPLSIDRKGGHMAA